MLRAAARRSAGIWCRAGADGAAALQGSAAACRAPAHAMTVRHASMFAAAMLSPSAAVAARRACGWPLQHGRGMSYFSGSHFDSDHMRDAKNPHLPEASAQPNCSANTLRLTLSAVSSTRFDRGTLPHVSKMGRTTQQPMRRSESLALRL